MIKVCCLGSGSKGNSIFIQVNQRQMLVDAGFSKRELGKRLSGINKTLDDITDIFITHEHGDHKAPWAYEDSRVKTHLSRHDVAVIPFQLQHDEECCGFTIEDADGNKVGIITDTGVVPEDAIGYLFDCGAILIETSYDVNLLVDGRYPLELQNRVAAEDGHLRNECAADVVRAVWWEGLRHIVCLHLSAANNNEKLAEYSILKVVGPETKVHVAEQDKITPMLVLI